MSLLLIAVFVSLISGLTGVGAKGIEWLQGQDTTALRRVEGDELAQPHDVAVQPRRTLSQTPARTTTPAAEQTPVVDRAPEPQGDKPATDTAKRKSGGMQLNDIINGKAVDSVVFDARNKMIYSYKEGDVTYQGMNLKADFMSGNMETKDVFAHGFTDSVDGQVTTTHPEFSDGGSPYSMDTITYNLDSRKAVIKGIATQEGDGWLVGSKVKMHPDGSIHIGHGMYTTCDCVDHPHFYLAMTQAKVIPGKKVITGYAYLVMEDVPIYFPGIPEGFFPVQSGPKSGLLMPTYGEDKKGFFIRDLGYYFKIGECMDLAIRGGIYTLGSWEVSARSQYVKRYKFRGNFDLQYSSIRSGEKGEPDYVNQNNYKIQWQHSQDPKANPGSTFSASVNLTSSPPRIQYFSPEYFVFLTV